MRLLRSSDLVLCLTALAAGMFFFLRLGSLWPLVEAELTRPASEISAEAEELLEEAGISVAGWSRASWVSVDSGALDYLEAVFGREATQKWIREGLPVAGEKSQFKKRGDARAILAVLQPGGGLRGWSRELEEDDVGASLEPEQARGLLAESLRENLGLDPEEWQERTSAIQERPSRRDHTFVLERIIMPEPELRERLIAIVGGDQVVRVQREVVIPAAFGRSERAAEAKGRALETVGTLLLAIVAIFAIWVFLKELERGNVRLTLAVIPSIVVILCLLATYALQTAYLFRVWESLWPRWVSTLQNIVWRTSWDVWMAIVLLAFVAAGDALDREKGLGRGDTLWAFFRGRWFEPGVAAASARGFLVGLICGGVLAASVESLRLLGIAETALQPRGFFFYGLNSASPVASTLLFFFNVALLEELGYRFFAATWLLRITGGRRWIAVVAPALLYGLTHTRLDFLPPASPFWARPLVLALVGCVWGWAFLRWDALTVVLSHWTADLFIFNWPRLASGDSRLVAIAFATLAVPLIPALLAWPWEALRSRTG